MNKLVLDANVAIDWFTPSIEGQAYSSHLIPMVNAGKIRFVVPLHFDVEVVGHLLKKHRQKSDVFTQQWLKDSLNVLDALPIEITAQGVNFTLLSKLANSYNLTAYDTPYFHLARQMEIPLATRDKGMISACKQWNVLRWQPTN